MIMPDDDYGMDHIAHSAQDNNHVAEIHIMLLNYARLNGLRIIELLGALEIAKHRIAFSTYAEEVE